MSFVLLCVSGLHHGVIAAAVLVAVIIFTLLAGITWFVYRRNSARFGRLHFLGTAYYRQSDSLSLESDGNVLMTDLENHSGE